MENQDVGAAESVMTKGKDYKSDSSSSSSKSVNSPGLGTDTKVVSRLGTEGFSSNLNPTGSQQQHESDESSTGSNKQTILDVDATSPSEEEGNLNDSGAENGLKFSSEMKHGVALQGTAIAVAADHAVLNISQVPSQGTSVVLADDNISPTSSTSSTVSGENAEEKLAKKPAKKPGRKPKSEKSVVHDTKEGVWTCRRCGWVYPNPRPSAKDRRDHRKNCGRLQNVHAWLGRSPEQTQELDGEAEELAGEAEEDLKAFVNVEHGGHLQIKAFVSQEDDTASSEDPPEETPQIQDGTVLLVSPRVDVHLPSVGISINGGKMPRAAVTELSSDEAAEIQQPSVLLQNAEVPVNVNLEAEKLDENEASVLQDAVNTADNPKEEKETKVSNEAHRETEDMKVDDQSTAEESSMRTTNTTSKKKIEYVEQKEAEPQDLDRNTVNKTSDVASTSNSGDAEHDLETILRQQTTHHLLCPNCGSCITKRVILRKRKRISVDREQEELPKVDEPLVVSTGGGSEEIQQEQNAAEDDGESEDWGCLACFSVFYRRVRGIRRSRDDLNEPLLEKAEDSPLQDRAQHFSCLPFLLPDFAWDGKGGTSEPVQQSTVVQIIQEETPVQIIHEETPVQIIQEETPVQVIQEETPVQIIQEETPVQIIQEETPDREGSRCLPLQFPWTKDKKEDTRSREIVIDLSRPEKTPDIHPEDDKEKPGKSEEQEAEEKAGLPLPFTSESSKPSEEAGREEHEQETPAQAEPAQAAGEGVTEEEQNSAVQSSEITAENKEKAGLNCLPAFFPAKTSTTQEELEPVGEKKAGFNCLPTLFPSSQEAQEIEDPESKEKAGISCLPVLLPAYPWGPSEASTTQQVEETHNQNSNLPALLPEKLAEEEQKKENVEIVQAETTTDTAPEEAERGNRCLPIAFPNYPLRLGKNSKIQQEEDGTVQERKFVTRDTRIRAWIRTITNVVTVKPVRGSADKIDTVQVGNTTSYVDVKLKDQPEALGKKPPPEVLTTTPSTGWALLDALDKEEEEEDHLVDNRKRPSLPPAPPVDEVNDEISEQTEIQEHKEITESAQVKPPSFDYMDDLRRPLLADSEKQADWTALLSTIADNQGLLAEASSKGPVSATVSVKSSDSLIQEDTNLKLDIAGALADTPEQQPTKVQEYVKSIVYGGLDVSLTSLAVVSSAAGADTKKINLFSLSLANLVAGLITLFHNIGSLHQNDRASFEKCVGQSLWINGSLAVLSYIVFGCIAPITYAFSFRSLDDRDYKFAATAAASLACLVLLGLGKAHVQKKGYIITISNLILTGFVAAVAGYFVGDYIKRWLHKIGFDDQAAAPPPQEPPPSPPPPPPFPFFPHLQGLVLGRRGRTSI